MRRLVALAAVSLLALAGCADEPDVVEVTVTETASSATPTTSTASSTASSSTSSTTPTGTPPDCSDEALQASPGLQEFQLNGCIGDFARPGVPQTDHVVLVQWTGKHWEIVESDGMWDGLGMSRPCHNRTKLESLGVPEEYIKAEAICGEYAPGEQPPSTQPNWEDASKERYIPYVGMGETTPEYAAEPACDGRGILIVDSIIDYGDRADTVHRLAVEVLTADPTGKSRQYTFPGQCPSLRAQVNGNDIYPVYLDFGQDTEALCRARANYGGDARVLSNRAEFTSPC